MDIALMFIVLFGLLALTVPIGVCLGITAMVLLFATTTFSPNLIAQCAFTGLDSFTLLAIPFFVIAGSFMQYGGISKRLLDLANSVIGFMTGGLAHVTTVTCMFFAAISGSGPATVSAIGSIMIPEMKQKGYDPAFAGAITACAGAIGVIIPPSIPFVIYAVATGASVGDLFIAGIIPGILIGIALMIVSYFVAKKEGWKGTEEKPKFRTVFHAFRKSILALFSPVIILGGIYAGIFSPTEAAVAGVVYSFLVGFFVYRELKWKDIYKSMIDAVLIGGTTLFMVGLTTSLSRILTMKQVPMRLMESFFTISDNTIILLLIINGLLLVVGCILDNISATIVLAPLLLPIVTELGLTPVQFGIVMTMNLAIGFITPPYGINLFVANGISQVPILNIAKRAIPLMLAMFVVLMLTTFIPDISLGLGELLK